MNNPAPTTGGRSPGGTPLPGRRTITAVLAAIALSASTILAGCAAAGAINGTQAAWCAFHVWRLERDIRNHHLGWGALQAALSIHHCRRITR